MADCCDSTNDCFCTITRSADGKKLILTIDPEKLPKQGEATKEGSSGKCCCC